MKLSVIVPSIRPQNLRRLYESVQAAYTGEFEFIVVSPYPEASWLRDDANVHWEIDNGSPVRCQQIGLTLATGDYVLWGCADDGAFFPGSVDKAIAKAGPNTVVIGKYYEGAGENPAMAEDKYYYINTHDCCRSEHIADDNLMFMIGVAPTARLKELGGLDTQRFETLPMAFNDLSVRMRHAGVEMVLDDKPMFHCSHMPGHDGDHGPVHDGQTLNDEPAFRALYNHPYSLTRQTISLDNWQHAPARWERRFGSDPA